MEEEMNFPRGGVERAPQKKEVEKASSSTSKRSRSRKRSNSKDFLFGKDTKDDTKRAKKSKSSSSQNIAMGTSSLPLGGGGVLQPTQSSSAKKPAFIEAISFQKLAKGMKLLGIVREVASEYAIVSLPNMLTGFIKKDKTGVPVDRVVSVGQFLSVIIVKATSESVKTKGGTSQTKRRIELSISPALLNKGLSRDMIYEGMSVRGKIKSVEDHGCIIDLHVNGLGGSTCFLKFENIKGKYNILQEDTDDEDEPMGDDTAFSLNKGRIYDFTIHSLPKSSNKESVSIVQVRLESALDRSKSVMDPAICLALKHTIRTLTPGMLFQADVEHFARNGLCVSFLGGVYRGAVDSSHLGGFLPENLEAKKIGQKIKSTESEMWWKNVFVGRRRSVG